MTIVRITATAKVPSVAEAARIVDCDGRTATAARVNGIAATLSSNGMITSPATA